MKHASLYHAGKRPLEIVFNMGSSNPNGQTIFNWQKEVVKETLKRYTPKSSSDPSSSSNLKPFQSIVYGITLYGTEAVPVVNIGEIPDTRNLSTFVDNLGWPGDGTSFEEGLLQAEKLFENSPNINPRKVLVLFLNDRTEVESSSLKALVERLMAKGIELRVISVGSRVDDDQINVLTSGSRDNVVDASHTEEPSDVAESLRTATAKGKLC